MQIVASKLRFVHSNIVFFLSFFFYWERERECVGYLWTVTTIIPPLAISKTKCISPRLIMSLMIFNFLHSTNLTKPSIRRDLKAHNPKLVRIEQWFLDRPLYDQIITNGCDTYIWKTCHGFPRIFIHKQKHYNGVFKSKNWKAWKDNSHERCKENQITFFHKSTWF